MRSKQEILAEVQEALTSGLLTEHDIKPLITPVPEVIAGDLTPKPSKPDKLSAVDVMFFVAGIILFSAIMSVIVQTWEYGSALVHILLSAGVGSGLWLIAYYLIKSSSQSDVRRGLVSALLLTGSLSIVVGGFIITNELIAGFDGVNFMAGAVTLAALGAVHLGFDRLVKREFTLLLGIVLSVAAFPTFISSLLLEAEAAMDVWSIVWILSSALLVWTTRVVAKFNTDRPNVRSAFDSFASLLALMFMYISSFGDYGVLWLMVLIASILGIFYLSIVSRNKQLLGSGSFFLVLTVITISFKYFSGYGITISLVLAAVGLLGSAAVASSINKKYFKQPPQ